MRSGFCLAALLLVVAATAQATVIHVPGDYSIIQDAVDAAGVGDTVMVGAGTYTDIHHPPGADTTQCAVSMKPDIYLIGAGPGQAIIDVQDLGRGIYCHTIADAHIEGFTIKRAFAEVYGAGIYCTQGSSPTITNCEITECTDGGIILTFNSHPDISYCDITGNVAKQGGGLAVENLCNPTISHCVFTGNSAPAGGGIYVGGMAAPTIEYCTIDDNFLSTANGAGAGIGIDSAQLTLRHSTVNGNISTGRGGGIDAANDATLVVEDTEIRNNTTAELEYGPGGGLYLELADVTLTRCTITGNSTPADASDGGGIYAFFTYTMTVSECTIAGNATNSVNGEAGGLYMLYSSPTIERTIIAFNDNGKGLHCDVDSTPNISCTDVFGNAGGDELCGNALSGNFSLDPRFCDLPNNDFTLHVDSPCLDNQHPTGAPCGQIGAHGLGTCDGIGVPDEGLENALMPPMRHFASPNPFGPSTTIHFGLHRTGNVWLGIYDVGGRRVRILEDRVLDAGRHQVVWDSRDEAGQPAPSGVYFYQLGGDLAPQTGRLVLTR